VVDEPDPQELDDGAPAVDFAAFYERERRGVTAMVVTLTGGPAAAEEVTQEAFLRAYVRWARVGAYERPEWWVRRVALNLAVSRWRRRRAEARALGRVMAAMATSAGAVAGQEAVAEDDVWAVVRTLPRRQAQVVALRYVEDRSDDEIADILGCAPGTVRAHLQRARVALSERLADR
jgi:RNA polymerase sigma-70 factor (ECF subfamily)